MKPAARHAIFLLFVSAFFATTITVLLYGSGYALMPGVSGLKKTGMLNVKAEPKNSTLLVNGVVRATKLPHRVVHLQPTTYEVELRKEGYHPWKKNLAVYPGETTFVTDVTLWRNAQTEKLAHLNAPYTIIGAAQGMLFAYALSQDIPELVTINTVTQQITPLYRSSLTAQHAAEPLVSTHSRYVLLPASPASEGPSVVVATASGDAFALGNTGTTTFKHFIWDDQADWVLFAQDENNVIWQYTVLDQSLRRISEGELVAAADASIVFIRKNTTGMEYEMVSYSQTTGREQIIATTPLPMPWRVMQRRGTSALVATNDNRSLRVHASEKKLEELPAPRVTRLASSSQSSVYAYATDNEVWLYSPTQGHALVWRTGDRIDDLRFMPGETYVMVATSNELAVLELDLRDSINNITLLGEPADSWFIEEETATLWYTMRDAQSDTMALYLRPLR